MKHRMRTHQFSSRFWRAGTTLIEIMIATGIIALVMTAIVSVITVSVRSAAQAKGKAVATKYSQEGMEFFRQQRAVLGWDGFARTMQAKGGTMCLAQIPTNAQFLSGGGGACASSNYVDSRQQFQRQATISTVSTGGSISQVSVTVRTTWYEGNQLRTNDIEQIFRYYQLTDAVPPSQFPVASPAAPPYSATVQSASSTTSDTSGANAVDNNNNTNWNAGGYPNPTQWIRISLGQPQTVSKISLVVNQYPAGNTTHKIYVSNNANFSGGFGTLVHTFSQYTSLGQTLTRTFSPPLTNVQYITVETTQSPSWVSWSEVQAFP